MAWEQLAIDRPHLVYIILGGFTSLFMLCSSVIKEKLYIGEATVATICGIIFGPHAANLIDPGTWGNTDQITLEFSRIVLVVQCFAVGVELPKAYMERHWRSVVFLLIPVMTFGWLVTSLFVWGLIPNVNWLDSLCIAACVTATDPVLASSVVGKGKFAKRVPKHLRDLLSAESGCNDGMAFPFVYLALYLLRYRPDANTVAFHWFCYTILYECIFGAFYGVCVGYAARRAIRAAHERDLIDRESFLVFYFVLALFCAGSGSILGMDDLLIGFACGVGFSNDGWFTEKTEESHVSNVIDLLINLAFFVYFGTIIPWEQYNADVLGLKAWRLVVVGILVLFFRRIPVMLALKPLIPDVKTWREALFAGHFGPIGVGALFVAILARAELETEGTTPLATLPEEGFEHLNVIELIWPVTTFLVICSIIVHGSSIAVFTLGKHINTLTLTMSYTTANEEGPSWMDRLPRIQSRSKSSMSMRRPDDTESEVDEKADYPSFPDGVMPGNFLRRQKEDDNPRRPTSRRSMRRRQWDSGRGPGGPISQSAISPAPRVRDYAETQEARSDSDTLAPRSDDSPDNPAEKESNMKKAKEEAPDQEGEPEGEVYEEGDETVYEDEEGNVLEVESSREETPEARRKHEKEEAYRLFKQEHVHHGVAEKEDDPDDDPGHAAIRNTEKAGEEVVDAVEHPEKHWKRGMKRMGTFGRKQEGESNKPAKPKPKPEPKRGPARAYQFGNTIIVEDEDGEVLKKYNIPGPAKKQKAKAEGSAPDNSKTRQRLQRMGTYLGMNEKPEAGPSTAVGVAGDEETKKKRKPSILDEDDDRIRFTVSSGGRRMSKAEFIKQIQSMDPKARARMVEESDIPEIVKEEAREDAREQRREQRSAQPSPPTRVPLERQEVENPETNEEDMAQVRPVASKEDKATGPEGLTLVDSNNDDIPFHNVTGTLREHGLQSPTGQETAAERRRREARVRRAQQQDQQPSPRRSPVRQEMEEDSEDDGTERVPPPVQRPSTHVRAPSGADVETEAERRRREGALGVSKEESSSDEDESTPRRPGIRFADEPRREELGGGGGGGNENTGSRHRLRWGRNVGR